MSILFCAASYATTPVTSPAEFGDLDTVRVHPAPANVVRIMVTGEKAKEIYNAMKSAPAELPDFPGTFSKHTGNAVCYQANSDNGSGVLVLKTKCSIAVEKF